MLDDDGVRGDWIKGMVHLGNQNSGHRAAMAYWDHRYIGPLGRSLLLGPLQIHIVSQQRTSYEPLKHP